MYHLQKKEEIHESTVTLMQSETESSTDMEKGCAEKEIEEALKKSKTDVVTECTSNRTEPTPQGIVLVSSSERCAAAPYGYVCTKADWGVYSAQDNKPGIVQLQKIYVIRAKFDPSLSCNWSAQANVFSNGQLVLTGSTATQASCGARNVASWSAAHEVSRGSVACGKYFEASVLQGSEECTIVSP